MLVTYSGWSYFSLAYLVLPVAIMLSLPLFSGSCHFSPPLSDKESNGYDDSSWWNKAELRGDLRGDESHESQTLVIKMPVV